MIKKTPYEVLGLKGDFEYSDIKKNYKQLIREYSPQSEPEMFAQIRDAYDILTNEEYFENSIYNDLFIFTLKEIKQKDYKINNIKYLTEMFETPFEL